ncbi:hypothetical protein HK102_001855 [Quaeritorhiza haematococci]|nr:hypothetical protein HK102_001855 [Quaeritorhiza haematococci]
MNLFIEATPSPVEYSRTWMVNSHLDILSVACADGTRLPDMLKFKNGTNPKPFSKCIESDFQEFYRSLLVSVMTYNHPLNLRIAVVDTTIEKEYQLDIQVIPSHDNYHQVNGCIVFELPLQIKKRVL